ncbi:MAG: BREX system P-loop protein BrxC [Chloroflexota bacterium]|nr:BREX system P-loop protein BrxC [Chloroflexota bacterium]
MSAVGTTTIRELFSTRRRIDRPIEKVIDYNATDPARLRTEVGEYEVTKSVEGNLRRFLDVLGDGLGGGQVTETGIWVSGFYGSGKSSFTKYLGFALDPGRMVDGAPFLDLFAERIGPTDLKQQLKTLARQEPVAVVMLDLGSEQSASSATAEVSRVLYRKVLTWADYSTEEKLARLELHLEREGRYGDFQQAYNEEFGGEWTTIHNDALVAVPRADRLVPRFYPQEYPEPGAFRATRFSLDRDARALAAEMLEIVRRKSGHRNVIFLIDEVGQYVAPRGDLILNLDGLARNLKELGEGRAWIVATGQQTLAEIVERAAYNSTELNKLRDRFPIGITLDASDIREITHRRLLAKSPEGEAALRDLFRANGQALARHTRLHGTSLFKGDPDEAAFVRFSPFLPQHFDLLLDLVRALARSRGGVGLRSAIRVIQDLLVDASKALPAGAPVLADAPVGTLATADAFYDTLRADIAKEAPHAVAAVDRIERALADDVDAIRVGKAIAVLQLLGAAFPRTGENLAALLYRAVGEPPNGDAVRGAINRLLAAKEIGLVDDPEAGRFTFLSEGVKPLRDRRNAHQPTNGELATLRSTILRGLFDPPPSAAIEGNAKTVRAGVRWGRAPLTDGDEEVQFQIESATGGSWEERRTGLLTETTGGREWRTTIAWLIRPDEAIDDALLEVARSQQILREVSESDSTTDIAQFARAERRTLEAKQEEARKLYRAALLDGTLIFRGKPTPAQSAGPDVETAARKVLAGAATEIYPQLRLVPIRPGTDLAAKFLQVERLDRMPNDLDPLRLVRGGTRPKVDPAHEALAEALRAFRERLDQAETTRLQGSAIQDFFFAAPYGWSKDATRYLFAGLLYAGEIELFAAAGVVRTPGPAAAEAMKNTQAFGKVGVGLRGTKPSLDALDRSSERLAALLGEAVMPLEENIARAARERLPARLGPRAGLPRALRQHEIAGAERAQGVLDAGNAILAGDGGGAVPILGAVESTFGDDLRWAEEAAKTLAEAEPEIARTREVLREADRVIRYFPGVGSVVSDDDRRVVADVLGSESFSERLPDLRQAVRQVMERAEKTYRVGRENLASELARARLRLEAEPGWSLLRDEERADLIGRLPQPPPGTVDGDQVLFEVGTLFGTHQNLPRLEAELRDQLRALADGRGGQNGGGAVLDIAGLLPREPLADRAAIERWLGELRLALEGALAGGEPVRIELTVATAAERMVG